MVKSRPAPRYIPNSGRVGLARTRSGALNGYRKCGNVDASLIQYVNYRRAKKLRRLFTTPLGLAVWLSGICLGPSNRRNQRRRPNG